MSTLTAFARRHQLSMFFVLAYALSWWAWVWYRLDPTQIVTLASVATLSTASGVPSATAHHHPTRQRIIRDPSVR